MKSLLTTMMLLLSVTLNGSAAAADGWNGNVNLLLGAKSLDNTEWFAYEHHETGILIDFAQDGWPVNIAIDLLRSHGDFSGLVYIPYDAIYPYEEDVVTREMNLGVRRYFDVNHTLRPYLGGGLALVKLEAEGSTTPGSVVHDEGTGSGIWLNGGFLWNLDAFNLGFDIRATIAEVDMDYGYFQGGGGHAGLLFGYHW